MNEVRNPGGNGPDDFQGKDMFDPGGTAPGGMDPGGLETDWGGSDEKINRGNRGMLIAFLLVLAAGVFCFYLLS